MIGNSPDQYHHRLRLLMRCFTYNEECPHDLFQYAMNTKLQMTFTSLTTKHVLITDQKKGSGRMGTTAEDVPPFFSKLFKKGRVFVFAAGTGNPYLTIDVAIAIRCALSTIKQITQTYAAINTLSFSRLHLYRRIDRLYTYT
ncbi:hypothetical protein Tco_1141227 [Tanacetum coccineum]